MKTNITITEKTEKTIEVELPYYYKQDLYSDYGGSVIYGVISKNEVKTIHEIDILRDGIHQKGYTIEKCSYWDGSYFTDKYKSNKTEYKKAYERAKVFLMTL